jgi:hypothetical protein
VSEAPGVFILHTHDGAFDIREISEQMNVGCQMRRKIRLVAESYPSYLKEPSMATMQETLLKPDVKDFERLKVRIHNHVCDLTLSQGDKEALVLRGPGHLLRRVNTQIQRKSLEIELGGGVTDRIGDAFTTSISRQKVGVNLTVRNLQELDLGGFVQGRIFALETHDLNLLFSGLGNLKIDGLRGKSITSTLNGSPSVQINGEVEEQRVIIKGMGQYRAGDLKTQRTTVHLSGSAFATLWVVEDLNVKMRGIGSIEYYGQPSITRRAVGMNNLRALGDR